MELLISAGRVLTGPGGECVDDGAVLVSGIAIAAVGTREEVERIAPDSARRAFFPDGTILPGLIDCHVHLAFDASFDPVGALREADDPSLLLGMAGRAQQLLAAGVTTARDLGDRGGLSVRLRDAIAAGVLHGPRILAATAPLTPPGGHCWFLGGEVSGEEAIRERVRCNAEAGADVIKIMATGGGLTKGGPATWQSQFTTDELHLVVEAARRTGLPVAAHAHGTDGIASAVAAGVNTIEHCTWMVDGGFEVRADVVADLVAKEIHVCPAASPNWRLFAERFGKDRAEELFGQVRWMAEQGVRLVAGTDAGVPGAGFDGFVNGLELYEHLGFSRDRILDMATIEAARALGIDADTGQLAAGYRADLLVVDGDPLRDLNALRALRLVLAGGRPYGNGMSEGW
ncbi:amidohydrolase family protein [Kitasatospora aureofaciens]|uniref:amidohydrolase family protein n=1 Tax=Kitasatospora aureofaciens TaxID=1894 RepID=UPI001C49774B|nr:amidohydrolase family protein [Kitasatospora aureofaciens]MBV6703107.1 amidohydrolase family protein [Kitasatospora aureofaciens]